ncbi:hypothetical protein ACFXMT_19980 [Streptomyces mirabilis]|uniref:hypothetical protein n=1 Tax=Streptomyces mirabilis TaxID=68239 RepID=UPI00368BD618
MTVGEPDRIDISGLNTCRVLAALWNNAAPPSPDRDMLPRNFAMTSAEAAEILLKTGAYFISLEGRDLMVNIGGDGFFYQGYDTANGDGLAARVIERLRETGSIQALREGT